MPAVQRVIVEVIGGVLHIQGNVPLPVVVTLLETAKAKLISDAITPPAQKTDGTADPEAETTSSSSRAPRFVVGKVA